MTILLTITTINAMLDYDFMRNAFAAAGVAAVVSGLVGYFLVLRGQTFAGHALGHIGFAGATGAVLISVSSVWGMVGFTVAAGIGMGLMGERVSGRDVAIGVVLALSLGFGLLFLHYYTAFAAQATSLLFGNVLAVDPAMIVTLIGLALVTLAAMAAIMRPLIFASLQPKLAEANGVRLRFVSTAILAIVALAVSESAQMSAFSWFSVSWWGRRRRHSNWLRGFGVAFYFLVASPWPRRGSASPWPITPMGRSASASPC